MTKKTVTILVVEDDDVDVETIRRGLDDLRIANPLRVAKDGLQALDILRGTGGEQAIDKPYLILLDINMPRMNGLEFLDELRSDPELKSTIVMVLTTSDQDKDMMAAYNHNVAGYILKDNAGKGFVEAITLLDHYWRYVEFPV